MQLWDTATLNEPAILETDIRGVYGLAFSAGRQAPSPYPLKKAS